MTNREPPVGIYPFRLTWENTDASGYVHNSVVFRYFEVGELEWFRSLGISWSAFPGVGFPRVHVSADFLKPLLFDDALRLETRVVRVRHAVVELDHQIFKEDALAVRGVVRFCSVRWSDGTPQPLPEAMAETLQPLCVTD